MSDKTAEMINADLADRFQGELDLGGDARSLVASLRTWIADEPDLAAGLLVTGEITEEQIERGARYLWSSDNVDDPVVMRVWEQNLEERDRERWREKARAFIAAAGIAPQEPTNLIDCPHWSPGKITKRKGCTVCEDTPPLTDREALNTLVEIGATARAALEREGKL